MAKAPVLVVVLLLGMVCLSSADLSDSEKKTCQNEMQGLMNCLPYSQKSADAPTSDCCKGLSGIRTRDAACLCYLLAITLSGDPTVKSLNLDSSRMLQLPTACQLQNTSVSECPKLLKLSASDPKNAFFNSSTPGHASSSPNATTQSSVGTGLPSSDAHMRQPPFGSYVIYAVFVAAFFSFFPTWP